MGSGSPGGPGPTVPFIDPPWVAPLNDLWAPFDSGSDGGVAAAVGPARWPRLVEASCGPRLREARLNGQVIPVPVDRRLQTIGLTGDRLPKSVAAAGRVLAALVVPVPPPPHRRRAARTGRAGETR